MTADFQKEYIKISRDMASMKSNDLYDFIKNEVNITKNRNKERQAKIVWMKCIIIHFVLDMI